jgi:predicted nucleotidyltransferase
MPSPHPPWPSRISRSRGISQEIHAPLQIDRLVSSGFVIFMNSEIRQLAEAAGKAANAEAVFLFGSQARGDSSAESDIDLALIIPDHEERRAALRAAIRATANRRRPLDLVVLSHTAWQQKNSLLARQVREEGIMAYGR